MMNTEQLFMIIETETTLLELDENVIIVGAKNDL